MRSRPGRNRLSGLILLLLMPAPLAVVAADPIDSSGPAWSHWTARAVPAGVPRTETLTPRVVWRLDCARDSEPLVGEIVAAAPGVDGRTLLVDRQLCRVLVVSPEGQIERTVGHEGEGPGELSGAWRALQLPDGRIGIVNGAPSMQMNYRSQGEIVLLDGADDPAGTWLTGGDVGGMPFCTPRELRFSAGKVLVSTYRLHPKPPSMQHVRELALLVAPEGVRTVVARSVVTNSLEDQAIREEEYFEPFAEGRCDLAASGRVVFAPERDRWLVAFREPDGSGFLVERPWRAVKRTEDAKRRMLERLGEFGKDGVLGHEPAIGRLRWRPDGCLWVEPLAVEPEPGAFACFDELDQEGRLLRRVQLVLPGTRERDELVLMEDGRFALLKGFKATGDADPGRGGAEVLLLEP